MVKVETEAPAPRRKPSATATPSTLDKRASPRLYHLIADNYSTHKQAKVKAWLERRPRFHMHFTPTSSSWMNLVERFFADITQECVRAGSFRSVPQLTRAITAYMAARNDEPKPYRWKADGVEILAKIQRAREALAGGAQN